MTAQDIKILEKIQEFGAEEQETDFILPKVDEQEWRAECLRVDKKLQEISVLAKESRKKHGYRVFDTVKLSSSVNTLLFRK